MERLQKVIAAAGVASRRKAEEMIVEGRVKVNGVTVRELGTKVSGSDDIEVDGVPLQREQKVYFLMNKPKKTLCAVSDDRGRETVLDYMPGIAERIYPVGRLDYDTTGVLLLTNDGEFANRLMHPRSHFPKTYNVTISGLMSDEEAHQLRKGIMLEDGMTLPASVHVSSRNAKKEKTELVITIFEGRNREIRRMMEYFGYTVTRLERIRYGNLTYGTLRQGEYRRLRMFEVKELLKFVEEAQSSEKPSRSGRSGSGSM